MSGPKCDEFELDEELRQEELRKIEEELKARREEEIRKQREEEERLKREEKEKREQDSIEFDQKVALRMERLKQRLYKKREQEIIAAAIDEAMEEMGYDVLASVEGKPDAEVPVQAKVYSFSEGVGVQVIESGERISMEIVGLGVNNRKPTENESEYLEEQMEDFCSTYAILEEKLKEKGIIRRGTIHHLPPDKKYARILNMDQFAEKKEVETLQTVMKKGISGANGNEQPIQKKKELRKQV